MTLESSPGMELVNVQAGGNPSPDDMPRGVIFPWGFFTFTVNNVGGGGTVVTLTLHSTPPEPNVYWKYGPEPGDPTPHWYRFEYDGQTGAEYAGNKVILHFVDGERGDHDLTINGEITDPSAPGMVPVGGVTEPFNLPALLQSWLLLAALVATGAIAAALLKQRAA